MLSYSFHLGFAFIMFGGEIFVLHLNPLSQALLHWACFKASPPTIYKGMPFYTCFFCFAMPGFLLLQTHMDMIMQTYIPLLWSFTLAFYCLWDGGVCFYLFAFSSPYRILILKNAQGSSIAIYSTGGTDILWREGGKEQAGRLCLQIVLNNINEYICPVLSSPQT